MRAPPISPRRYRTGLVPVRDFEPVPNFYCTGAHTGCTCRRLFAGEQPPPVSCAPRPARQSFSSFLGFSAGPGLLSPIFQVYARVRAPPRLLPPVQPSRPSLALARWLTATAFDLFYCGPARTAGASRVSTVFPQQPYLFIGFFILWGYSRS